MLLLVLILAGSGAAFWFGLVPQRWSPFAPVSLVRGPGLFVDLQLAALRRDPQLCAAVLEVPHIEASQIPDQPPNNGCGWTNAVRMSTTGGIKLPADKITCELAAAVTLWVEHELQPLALATFGKRITSALQMGTYSCRNIIGNSIWKDYRSQHATANAIDIGGFTLEGGTEISVLKHWSSGGKEAQFLREAHRRSCRYFRVSLGPDFNAAHKDHFHFDRGPLWTCK